MAQSHADRLRFANREIAEQGKLDLVDQVFSPDYVLHAGGKLWTGTPFVRTFIRQLRTAIPDLRVVKLEILLEKGRTVAWQRTLRGTHTAALKGIPASGRKVEWIDMLVTRFEGGKIAEEWAASELAAELFAKQ